MIGGFDFEGALSIVVQGAVDEMSVDTVMRNCARWRRLFPHAELICAVSPSANDEGSPGIAEARLAEFSDVVVRGDVALPLPPMKTDSPGPNHVNLMISAARAGLAQATGRHVLRVRNDLVFHNRAFLSAYCADAMLPRGGRKLFKQRVMVPEVFTLNPFTHVRLPFHFSDWFHFGLTEDVRTIWGAARLVSVEDGAHYTRYTHRAGSNIVERRFNVRLAPEQTVHFPVFAAAFPDLRLACHNDPASRDASLAVLADNFVLANLAATHAELPKYRDVIDAMSPYTRLECLSQSHLKAIALRPGVPFATLFAEDIARTRRYQRPAARLARQVRRAWFACLRRLRTARQ